MSSEHDILIFTQYEFDSIRKERGLQSDWPKAINTICGFGSLFERQAGVANARIMYSKALVGHGKASCFGYEDRGQKSRDCRVWRPYQAL
jgi:hypothetical protein